MAGNDNNPKQFAFVVYPGLTLLDLVTTYSLLGGLPIGSPYRTVIAGERTEPIDSDSPLIIVGTAISCAGVFLLMPINVGSLLANAGIIRLGRPG